MPVPISSLYLAHLAARALLARRFLARHRLPMPPMLPMPPAGETANLLVLQPILAGDPDLAAVLQANLDGTPGVRFVWLVDEDDALAREIAARLADSRVQVLLGPPPRDGENPKLAKLERGLALAREDDVVVVLDDDTRIGSAKYRVATPLRARQVPTGTRRRRSSSSALTSVAGSAVPVPSKRTGQDMNRR